MCVHQVHKKYALDIVEKCTGYSMESIFHCNRRSSRYCMQLTSRNPLSRVRQKYVNPGVLWWRILYDKTGDTHGQFRYCTCGLSTVSHESFPQCEKVVPIHSMQKQFRHQLVTTQHLHVRVSRAYTVHKRNRTAILSGHLLHLSAQLLLILRQQSTSSPTRPKNLGRHPQTDIRRFSSSIGS